MASNGGGELVTLAQAWLRLMRIVGFKNPGRARSAARARAAVTHLMRHG